MFETEQNRIRSKIKAFCREHDLPDPGEIAWSPIPFDGEWGISVSFYKLAAMEARQRKAQGTPAKSVQERAQEIALALADYLAEMPGFSRIEAVKGYLNLYFPSGEFSKRVIDNVLSAGDRYGSSPPNALRVMVEYSQPNTHKAFHVGHLRNAILGAAICNILEFSGYEVVRANYIGDIGLHVIQWLWNYLDSHNGEEPGTDKTRWMGDLYAEAVQKLEVDPGLESDVRALFARWDRQEPDIVRLWKTTRQWSLEGFEQIYQTLGVRFDRVYYESECEEPGKQLVEELIQRGIAIDERPYGPVIIRLDDLLDLEKERYRVLVILRSDDTSLYATKDLPLAIQKFEEYDLHQSIYVIDVRQSFYLQQIYKTLEIMGYPWADRCYHLAYEIVNLPGNVTMSSREGTVVLLEDLIQEATERARQIVEEKNPSLDDRLKDQVARSVALGALKYTMLSRENTKTVTFDWDSALDFNGQAAPYIQYAHVRAASILRRMEGPLPDSHLPDYNLDPTEIELVDWISRFPGEVVKASQEYKPLRLTNLAYELARAFNNFYNKCPVLQAEPAIRDHRLRLVSAAKQSLANTLGVLGITSPEVM